MTTVALIAIAALGLDFRCWRVWRDRDEYVVPLLGADALCLATLGTVIASGTVRDVPIDALAGVLHRRGPG